MLAKVRNCDMLIKKLTCNFVTYRVNVDKIVGCAMVYHDCMFCRVWNVHTGEMLNTLIHHCEAVLHLRFQEGMMVTCSKVFTTRVLHVCFSNVNWGSCYLNFSAALSFK